MSSSSESGEDSTDSEFSPKYLKNSDNNNNYSIHEMIGSVGVILSINSLHIHISYMILFNFDVCFIFQWYRVLSANIIALLWNVEQKVFYRKFYRKKHWKAMQSCLIGIATRLRWTWKCACMTTYWIFLNHSTMKTVPTKIRHCAPKALCSVCKIVKRNHSTNRRASTTLNKCCVVSF